MYQESQEDAHNREQTYKDFIRLTKYGLGCAAATLVVLWLLMG